MDFSDQQFPFKRPIQMKELSPSVHWAQYHRRMANDNELNSRQIYDFELLFLKEGKISMHLSNQYVEISAGKLILLSAGIPHGIQIISEPDALFLGVHFDFFDELEIQKDEDIIVKETSIHHSRFCCEPLIEGFQPLSLFPISMASPQIIMCMEQIIVEFNLRQPGYELACKGLMQQVITQLLRSQVEDKKVLHPIWGKHMIELAKWIESNFAKDCANALLAKQMNLHEDYMAKQFKLAIGMPPNKFVQFIRQRESKRLLRETDELIASVGQLVGYEDIHYFCRIFHKWEGISPREYRNLSRVL